MLQNTTYVESRPPNEHKVFNSQQANYLQSAKPLGILQSHWASPFSPRHKH